jgi:lipopolysaccharide heptosyltransferase II
VTHTAVIQVKQGIGDVVWHLPFIRAIAGVAPGGAVTFLTLPSSHARDLLQAEPCVAETLYFEHQGNELQRGLHLAHLAGLLRGGKFARVWILDSTVRPALAALLARVPERIGLGLGAQRLLITNKGIDPKHMQDWPVERLVALMAAMQVPLATTEPNLKLPEAVVARVGEHFRGAARPWAVLGLGGSNQWKQWPAVSWMTFVEGLRRRSTGTVFLIGGPTTAAHAQDLIAHTAGAAAINACDLSIVEAAALLGHADVFVGTDSGPMNLAAAVGTVAFALFGATPVLSYSRFIHPITPGDGKRSLDGMQRISPERVLARVEPYLTSEKAVLTPRPSP